MVMIAVALGLAATMVLLDQYYYLPDSALFNWISNIGPGGARAVFATIAGSTITVAGTIFSIAMVVLVMASSQFGPRLIPTFMRVGKIQFGIGLFVGTFVYCLILLTFVPAENKGELLPVWGVLTGVILGVCAFLVLIMLIHEIATFIQAPVVTQRVARDIIATFDRVFPESNDVQEKENTESTSAIERPDARPLRANSTGYVLTIDYKGTVALATEHHCVVHFKVRPGDYVVDGQIIGMADPGPQNLEGFRDSFCEEIKFGADRNLTQDARYAIDQMVEIAVRALSPGINDPFTAINCIDKLSSALAHLSTRRTTTRYFEDADGILRVAKVPDSYEEIVEASFGQIRHYAIDAPAVLLRLIEAIGKLARLDLDQAFARALHDQLRVIGEEGVISLSFEHDNRILRQRYEEVLASFEFVDSDVEIT